MIKTKTILEIAGSPKDHVEKTLELVLGEIEKEKTYTLEGKDIAEIQENKGLFSTYVELDLTFKDINALYTFCFDFMPSSVDIIEPTEVKVDAMDFGNALNDLLATLHQRENSVREVNAKNKILQSNLNAMLSNLLGHLTENKVTMAQIHEKTGIPEEKLGPILESFVKDGKLKKEGDTFQTV